MDAFLQPSDPTPDTSWQSVQDGLARVAGQALGRLSAPDGQVHTPISRDNPICRMMQQHAEAAPRCAAQCGDGAMNTFHTGRSQLFQCHAKLSVFFTLISPTGEDPAQETSRTDALVGGKVFLSYEDIHRFRAYAEELGLAQAQVEALIPDIRLVPLDEVKAFMEQARRVAETMVGLEIRVDASQEQTARMRYLMEIFSALESEPVTEIPKAVLHGLGILFRAGAGVILAQATAGAALTPEATFCGNGAVFTEQGLSELSVESSLPWLAQALENNNGTHYDSVYDLIKAGFPAETQVVDLFPLSIPGTPHIVALLNTSLTPDDRAAVAVFCRYAGLLLENTRIRAQLQEQDVDGGATELSPALWESADPEALCQGILDRAVATVEAEQGSVMLLDPKEDRLRIRAIHGVNLKYVEYVRIRRGEGISGSVLDKGEPLLVADIAQDPHISQFMRSRYKSRSFISVPIQLNDRPLGVLNVTDKKGGRTFSRQDLKKLIPIAQQAALAIDRIQALKQTEEFRKASVTDYLTGLLNRESFDKRLAEEVERAQRYPFANPLSLLVVDIDDFRRINDAFGYFTGDDCIKGCSRTLQAGTRTIDSVYRRGGEEFTVVLPHTSREAALTLAARLCLHVEKLEVVSRHTPNPVSFTVSIGLATYPEDGTTGDSLFKRANQALHFAKRNGKNQAYTLPVQTQKAMAAGEFITPIPPEAGPDPDAAPAAGNRRKTDPPH